MKSNMAHINGLRRPYLSLIGPNTSCPAAKPTSPVVSPSCTNAVEHPNHFSIAGRTGRYISMTKGPKALSAPKKIIVKTLLSSCLSFSFMIRVFLCKSKKDCCYYQILRAEYRELLDFLRSEVTTIIHTFAPTILKALQGVFYERRSDTDRTVECLCCSTILFFMSCIKKIYLSKYEKNRHCMRLL